MFKKIYIEISDICGLKCSFCPTKKARRGVLSIEDFELICAEVCKFSKTITLHLLGDPLILPNLKEYLNVALKNNLKVEIVTSGFYLRDFDLLCSPPISQVSISMSSFLDKNNSHKISEKEYLDSIFCFCEHKVALDSHNFINLRIHNDKVNPDFVKKICDYFCVDFVNQNRIRLAKKVFLNFTKDFSWPNLNNQSSIENKFCYGLISHIGILSNGNVVPCCIDGDGVINLGNIFELSLEEIINSHRARAIRGGFLRGEAIEELCKKCKY